METIPEEFAEVISKFYLRLKFLKDIPKECPAKHEFLRQKYQMDC